MRKFLPFMLFGAMLLLAFGAYFFNTYDPYDDIPKITLDRINSQETDWYAEGIFDYRIEVLIEFASEQRKYELTIENNVLKDARSTRWDETIEEWGAYTTTPAEEAEFFTVPGLFSMLRNDLLNEDVEREAIRMALAEGESYPGIIYLGNIIQDGVVAEDTELVIQVLSLSVTSP